MDDVAALDRLIADRQRDLNTPSLIAMYRAANLPKGAVTYETLRRMAADEAPGPTSGWAS